jgi:hypothetical protein
MTLGVILVRLAGMTATRKAEIVSSTISQHLTELPHRFAVIAPRILRIRRLSE